MKSLTQKLSILTTIPKKHLDKLISKTYLIISDDILESIIQGEDVSEIDIGIGFLYIQVLENSVKYKFIPNQELDSAVKAAIVDQKSALEDILESSIVDKIINTYKDFI